MKQRTITSVLIAIFVRILDKNYLCESAVGFLIQKLKINKCK